MKKILLSIMILMSLSLSANNSIDKTIDKTSKGIETVYVDGKKAVSTIYSDVKTVSPQIEKGVKEIAKGLKIGSDSVWKILIKQQLVWSICILFYLIGTILSWIHFWYRFKVACENNWGRIGSGYYELICIMCASMSIAGSGLVVIHFNDMVTGFMNPEFGAIKTIVEVIKNIK